MAMILEGLTTCGGESRKFFSFESRVYIRGNFVKGFYLIPIVASMRKSFLLFFAPFPV